MRITFVIDNDHLDEAGISRELIKLPSPILTKLAEVVAGAIAKKSDAEDVLELMRSAGISVEDLASMNGLTTTTTLNHARTIEHEPEQVTAIEAKPPATKPKPKPKKVIVKDLKDLGKAVQEQSSNTTTPRGRGTGINISNAPKTFEGKYVVGCKLIELGKQGVSRTEAGERVELYSAGLIHTIKRLALDVNLLIDRYAQSHGITSTDCFDIHKNTSVGDYSAALNALAKPDAQLKKLAQNSHYRMFEHKNTRILIVNNQGSEDGGHSRINAHKSKLHIMRHVDYVKFVNRA